jgi:hypothetical protein
MQAEWRRICIGEGAAPAQGTSCAEAAVGHPVRHTEPFTEPFLAQAFVIVTGTPDIHSLGQELKDMHKFVRLVIP